MGKLFDIAISFAMENEELADTVYHYLKAEGHPMLLVRQSRARRCPPEQQHFKRRKSNCMINILVYGM